MDKGGRAHNIIAACQAHYHLPNLRFSPWNYRFGKPADLEPADVLLCAMGVVGQPFVHTELADATEIRRSREYLNQRDHAAGNFGPWRMAARQEGLLFAVFRLQPFPRFLAWVDAAQQAGWTPLLDRLGQAVMPQENRALPSFVFQNQPCTEFAEMDVLAAWAPYYQDRDLFARLHEAAALSTYRAFGHKEILATREYQRQKVLTRDEIGRVGASGYVFTQDATCTYRLLLVSLARAKELAAGASARGSSTPITDEGTFFTPATAASPFAHGAAAPGAVFFGGSGIAGPIT